MISKTNSLMFFVSTITLLLLTGCWFTHSHIIPLQGEWKFKKDSLDIGFKEKWYNEYFDEKISLPGIMAEYGKGNDALSKMQWTVSVSDSAAEIYSENKKSLYTGNLNNLKSLRAVNFYSGTAWYQKEVTIPLGWEGKHIVLKLERPYDETMVWLDGTFCGSQSSNAVPHIYDLSSVADAGKHRLTIKVNNNSGKRFAEIILGDFQNHAKWNGITGNLYLEASSAVFIEDVQVYPEAGNKLIKIAVTVINFENNEIEAELKFKMHLVNATASPKIKPFHKNLKFAKGTNHFEFTYPLDNQLNVWDEFFPTLYNLKTTLTDETGIRDIKNVHFGIRNLETNENTLKINERPLFLRGSNLGNIFPETGYPPTNQAFWEQLFKKYHDFGLNNIHFTSWCPPDAAFSAADKAGFYLFIELPGLNSTGLEPCYSQEQKDFQKQEIINIIKTYGNHPSFCFLGLPGNISDDEIVEIKNSDTRKLYTLSGSGTIHSNSDFIVLNDPDIQNKVPCIINASDQYYGFPDYKNILKFKGIYQPDNLEFFQKIFLSKFNAAQAEEFFLASGKFQMSNYKSYIETILGTPGLSGFELWSINDYIDNDLVFSGVMDAFFIEKGYITASQFARFCNQTVPIAGIPKFIYLNNESFQAGIEAAHFGNQEIVNVKSGWKIIGPKNSVLSKGVFENETLPIGNCFTIGNIDFPLSAITEATKLTLEVSIKSNSNSWDVWVFPEIIPVSETKDIYITTSLDATSKKVLAAGGKVLFLISDRISPNQEIVKSYPQNDEISALSFKNSSDILGLFCNSKHPVFNNFPAENYYNQLWIELLQNQPVINLDLFPAEFEPLIYIIDSYKRNNKLAVLFETRVANGKCMVCSIDLSQDNRENPAALQFYYSLINYMNSANFNPLNIVDITSFSSVFEKQLRKVN
ncbi:MAG: hypothetical protein JXJ22_00670 [Bacteroidales bacterium]|nr:hypothetical protein [Bacteroidales bacterium]